MIACSVCGVEVDLYCMMVDGVRDGEEWLHEGPIPEGVPYHYAVPLFDA